MSNPENLVESPPSIEEVDDFNGVVPQVDISQLPPPPLESTVPKYLARDLTAYSETSKKGSFGAVTKVFSPLMGPAAHKKLHNSTLTENQQKNWKREMESIYKLNHHPNIVKLYGYVYEKFTDPMPNGILMEFMSGGNLYEHILKYSATGKYPTSPALKNTWAKQIALGLNFIHSLKIMHRDFNILLCQNRHVAKIADFGYSRPIDPTGNHTKGIGNPIYTAPEVYMEKGDKYRESADVWSYAMVLYFIYYEKNPYEYEALRKISPFMRVAAWKGEQQVANMAHRPPLNGRQAVNTIIQLCWKTVPEQRCTMTQVVNFFHNFNGVKHFPSVIV